MESALEDPRPRYRLCRAGFALIALSLALLCAAKVSLLALMFGAHREVMALHGHPAWFWLVDVPVTWGALLGSYLLWGRWPGTNWHRRAGMLVLMNFADALMWTVDRLDRFGLEPKSIDLGWTFFLIANSLAWIEMVLAAGLASELAAHLGREPYQEVRQAVSTLAFIGSIVWGFLAITQTNWSLWPPGPGITPEFHLLLLITTILMTIPAFQTTVLCLSASRFCAEYLRELDRKSREDPLLQSRSESDGDDVFWYD